MNPRNRLALNVAGISDGTYDLVVDVKNEARSLGAATLSVNLRQGLDRTVADLEAAAASMVSSSPASLTRGGRSDRRSRRALKERFV